MKTAEEIKNIVENLLEGTDLFFVDLHLSKNNVIELFIDSPQGVDISTCSRISRELETCLNREEEDFELTVSSAGIGYPFKVPGQYVKNIGKKVSVKLTDSSRIEGILQSYMPSEIILECEEKRSIEGKKKKETVKVKKQIQTEDIKEIKDIVSF